jgi:hypothetical protein
MLLAVVFNQAAQTLGGAAGRTYPIGNYGPALFGCAHVVLATTATVGNRVPVLRVLDAANNVLFEGAAQANVAASATGRLNWGAGMISGATAPYQFMGVPDMPIPPGSQVNIFDSANIDANDTIATNVTVGML